MSGGRFSQGFIERVAAATDIAAVIGRYTNLVPRGNRLLGLCPFHTEKTPSFSVDPEQGLYYCFGCHAGGTVFTFLMEKEGMSFPEAVETLAREAGIDLPSDGEGERSEGLLEAAEYGARFFQKALKADVGAEAREYLAGRGISRKTWEAYGLGWAPADRHHLSRSVAKAKRKAEPFEKIGLLRESYSGLSSGIHDVLVFPIQKAGGRVVGFAQRRIREGGDGPKYINSADNEIYHKSSILYGLSQARRAIRKEKRSLLVEGYFDVIALAENGIQNAVASCGTALTPAQASLLMRYAPRVAVLFDGDNAGLSATVRSLPILLAAGLDPSVVRLPAEDDPDSFVRDHGADALIELIDSAPSWFDWLFDFSSKEGKAKGVSAVVSIVDAMAMPLAAVQDGMMRDMYLRDFAVRIGTSEEALREHLRKAFRKKRGLVRSEEAVESAPELPNAAKIELAVLAAVMRSERAPKTEQNPLSFYPGLWDSVVSGAKSAELLSAISDARARSYLSRLLIEPAPTDLAGHVETLLRKLERIRLDSEIERLNADLREAERIGDKEKQKRISKALLGLGNSLGALYRKARERDSGKT